MSRTDKITAKSSKINNIINKMRKINSITQDNSASAVVAKVRSNKEKAAATADEVNSAINSLSTKKLSRTPTVYEEASGIEEIAEDISLQEETSTKIMEALSIKQADLYAKAVYEAITSGGSIFTVPVPMVKELTEAYASELESAIVTGNKQVLAQAGLSSKLSKINKVNVKAISKILARVYTEKRAADVKFDLLKAAVLQSIDILLSGEGK